MTQISLTDFLTGIDAIVGERPSYAQGHDGSDGLCDCIGLIIGAVRRSGGSWSGTHGSNYAARSATDHLLPLDDAATLSVGELVYKSRDTASSGYALPNRYEEHPDQLDYYHVGIVRSVEPLMIIHCTTPGIVTDTTVGQWSHHGWLKLIVPDENGADELPKATVAAASGSTVNLRRKPQGALVARVPIGSEVTLLQRREDWCQIAWRGYTGWMMARYLSGADDNAVSITLPRSDARRLRDVLNLALGEEEQA